MSKTALNMGSKLVHNYVQPEGIKVLALHPGWFNSSGEGHTIKSGCSLAGHVWYSA